MHAITDLDRQPRQQTPMSLELHRSPYIARTSARGGIRAFARVGVPAGIGGSSLLK
jgi:hypothetical protein